MKYCKRCVMPDTRPGMKFNDEGVCYPCLHYDARQEIDWEKRWEELEKLADKYRGCNGDYYDCIITASGGKDSYYQTHVFKEKLGMNPLIVSVGNYSWTETGKKNWANLMSTFGVDAIQMNLSPQTCKKM
ncbi:MAG TPA: N-acetyl sugar amidotransferase, partial [Candidatus Thermoplasmatota archaeon]|nr:N-acetyl sugar amidotransferase [Candidatus Thermoplasmatota archaeon]